MQIADYQINILPPPFSVLDTRQGYWRERKRQWLELIGNTAKSREYTISGKKGLVCSCNNGVSIFDPVLSEIIAKWFAPYEKSYIFDPMAGDVNKGLVFAELGHYFAGIELRQEQVDDNNKAIIGRDNIYYVCDDGRNVLKHFAQETQDLLISCPPYFDLEVYSDNENDASNQKSYKDFIGIIEAIYSDAIKVLRRNRFAVIVVGDVRGKDGIYYGFHHDVVDIFTQNGMKLYNELILLETAGTKPLLCAKPMESRKVSKVHQNVLVFYKGDTKKIKEIFKPIEIDEDRVKEYLGENNE